jgi:Xaa-Pro aminopeptidase
MHPLSNVLTEAGLDALLVTQPENVRYLSGFTSPKDGWVAVWREEATLVTDPRYTVQAQQESRIPHRIAPRERSAEVMAELLRGRVGFEANHLVFGKLQTLREQVPAEWVPTSDLVERLRLKKTPEELERIRAAARLADEGYAHILPLLKPGVSEADIALELEFFLRKHGSEGVAFEIIVASGERGAMPHGVASSKKLRPGELVTLDFGAVVGGYHSDMTRTVALGEVSRELREVYEAVLEAQQAALEAVRPGRTGQQLDAIARQVLQARGYGEYFAHGLGHGVGLAIHEGPRLSKLSEDVLEAGMVLTIEPGVYIPGVGGCRIEDLVLVTETGYEVLSHSPKGFSVL